MFQRGSVRSSLPPPSKLGARQYGLIVEEQMRKRREDMRQVHDHRRFEGETRLGNEYQETKNSMFNCISNGMLYMDQIAKVIWNLKQRRVLNQKAYDEFVNSDEAATAVSKFDGLYISGDERDIWYNIMANRLQCEINRALINRNAKKENVQGYYILQEVELVPETTTIINEEPGIENLKK
ncbi:unnamed protein product [Cylicocyclus nassatus]|uniref:Uncharacterized protein n=1 Tax=Cylicocyclus nassatus TaxID=53992 RepID=A0AA36M139_CYLNA|nr:unnamed protein product [Cylicocyclus nassatus]